MLTMHWDPIRDALGGSRVLRRSEHIPISPFGASRTGSAGGRNELRAAGVPSYSAVGVRSLTARRPIELVWTRCSQNWSGRPRKRLFGPGEQAVRGLDRGRP